MQQRRFMGDGFLRHTKLVQPRTTTAIHGRVGVGYPIEDIATASGLLQIPFRHTSPRNLAKGLQQQSLRIAQHKSLKLCSREESDEIDQCFMS